jgi:hypothetical protein
MATTSTKPPVLGADEASRLYEEAASKLRDSLDDRKRLFDPTWLAFAQGMLAPTQTGGFGEALGNAAKSVGAAQDSEEKRNQELLQAKVGLAGQGVEIARAKANEKAMQDWLAGEKPAPAPSGPLTAPQVAPVVGSKDGPLSAPSAPEVPAAAPSQAPVGGLTQVESPAATAPPVAPLPQPFRPMANAEDDGGIQIMPPNPNLITSVKQYVALNRSSGKPLAELIKEGSELVRKNLEVKESGSTNIATGKLYPSKAALIDYPIFGEGYEGKTFKIPESVALQLSLFQQQNNEEAYRKLANTFTKGFPAANSGVSDGPKSVEERAIANKEAEVRAGKLGEAAAAKEATLEETEAAARRVYGSATRILSYLKESPNFFGTFARPGIVAAIGNLVKEGIQTPGGTLNLAGFEDSVRQLMPNVKQKDLDNVVKAGTEFAEIELAFTRLYMSKQGAITEGERKIVRAIPGTVSNSPEVLRTRMELLKARSQYDIDVADSFRQWQDKNPGRSYLDFERKSDLYKDIKKNFEAETEKIFGGIKAVPTSQRKQEAAASNKGGKDLGAARARVDDILKAK